MAKANPKDGADAPKKPAEEKPNDATNPAEGTGASENPTDVGAEKNAAASTAGTAETAKPSGKPALEIVSFDTSFYRAGLQFTRTPRVVLVESLTAAQVASLMFERHLSVRQVLV